MLAAQLNGFGHATDVLGVVELPKPEPGPGQILLEMLAAPVNPADLNIVEGKYGELPTPGSVIGNEGVGRVVAVGREVTAYAPGDLVLPMQRGTWAQYMAVDAEEAILLPAGIDPLQAAMLSVNPPTALLMLEDFVGLRPGDWIVQNAANSAVGRCVIQIADAMGWRTLNVVRRPSLVEELEMLGADAVVLEDFDLRTRAGEICGGERPRLGLNAVGGASALNLANALADGGTLVTYGAMGRQPLKIPNGLLIFRLLTFAGFWLKQWKETASGERREEVFATLAAMSSTGRLHIPVSQVFPLREVHAALSAAAIEGRTGKVLLDLQAP